MHRFREFFMGFMVAACAMSVVPAMAEPPGDQPKVGPPNPAIEIMPVDEVQPGMQGTGKTVLQGTRITEFQARILGVLHRVSPGRDVILCRLSGANLEYTGVIAGMSGSPIYVDGKLLGAIAYTWSFNKEPIAGITPFEQMRTFSDNATRCDGTCAATAQGTMPLEGLDLIGLSAGEPKSADPLFGDFSGVAVAVQPGQMQPIRLPLSASGFGPRSMAEMRRRFQPLGMIPIAGGGQGTAKFHADAATQAPLRPGDVLAASLVTGDFDMSGIGTVTHVEGSRVWGWGHPFLSGGRCAYLLRRGQIHLVNPKQDLSTKMGTAGAIVGVIDADVSTCVAGNLGQRPNLMPMTISIQQGEQGRPQVYHCRVVRHPKLLGPLVATVLAGALEAGGGLDQEITVGMNAEIHAEGIEPIIIHNTYSGRNMAGNRGVQRMLNQVALIADGLTRNPFKTVPIKSIECHAVISPGRTSATITAVRLNSDTFEPGDELTVNVTLRPYKADPVEVKMRMRLPKSIPPGRYTATVCDATIHLKNLFNEQPRLLAARSLSEIVRAYRLQLSEKRSTLFLRVVTRESGLSVGDVSLPQLPSSVRAALTSRRASPVHSIKRAEVVRQPTDWVIEGSSSLSFKVVSQKKVAG